MQSLLVGAGENSWAIIMIILSILGMIYATWDWVKMPILWIGGGLAIIVTFSSFSIENYGGYDKPFLFLVCLVFTGLALRMLLGEEFDSFRKRTKTAVSSLDQNIRSKSFRFLLRFNRRLDGLSRRRA